MLNESVHKLEETAELLGVIWGIVETSTAKEYQEDMTLKYKDATMRKRKDNVYEIRYRRNGYNKSFYSTIKTEVKAKFNEWYEREIKNAKKQIKKPQEIKAEEWIETWLENYKKPVQGEATFYETKLKVNKYILSKLQGRTMKSITNMDIQIILNEAVYRGKPQNKVYTLLKNLFKIALQNKIIKEDPTVGVYFKKAKDKHAVALTEKEREEFLTAIKDDALENYYKFLLYSGVRRAEGLNVKKSDIKDGYIHIRGTKTDGADRYIPYFPELQKIVKSISTDELFQVSAKVVSDRFKEFSKNHTVRDLRKTFATMCHEKGISPKVVQKWLGHSKLDMTMNVYTEVTQDFEQTEMLKFTTPKYYPTK